MAKLTLQDLEKTYSVRQLNVLAAVNPDLYQAMEHRNMFNLSTTRLQVFLLKWQLNMPFKTQGITEVHLRPYNMSSHLIPLLKMLVENGDSMKSGKVQFLKTLHISSTPEGIEKTPEFGGEYVADVTSRFHVNYGMLEMLGENFSKWDLSAFSETSPELSTSKTLVRNIKEESDVYGVSAINTVIMNALGRNPDGITVRCGNFTFSHVVGCVPVTNREPKADMVLVSMNAQQKKLFPSCYISYKKGNRPSSFFQYSGISEKSSDLIARSPITKAFFEKIQKAKPTEMKNIYEIITNQDIIAHALWGKDYGKTYGVNNVHVVAQGTPSITGDTLTFQHIMKNGDFTFVRGYEPVFGSKVETGRTSSIQEMSIQGIRIAIYPRAFRTTWMR